MIWQSWGHSVSAKVAGEYSSGEDALSTYEGQRFFAWFDHYLKGASVSTGPDFAFYRSWVPFSGSGPDTVQYGTASSYPVGNDKTYYLSANKKLVPSKATLVDGSLRMLAPGAADTSYSETSEAQGSLPDDVAPPRDAPGTFVQYTSAPLGSALDVVGIPTVSLQVSAPTVAATQSVSPANHLVLFVKLYDVDAAGNRVLVNRLVSPVRVADVHKPFTVSLPGIVHEFAAGHHFQLAIAGSDAAYKGNAAPVTVSVLTSRSAPGILHLPIVG
jgi:ABC-2 type transport system ATP-binding protein